MMEQLCTNKFGPPSSPVPRKQNLNPWNFPSDRNVIVIHGGLRSHLMFYTEVAQHGPLDSLC